jgi:hypothetical protein
VSDQPDRPLTIVQPGAAGRKLRTPRSAGLAGIGFSLLFGLVLVLARVAVPSDPKDTGEWVTDDSRRGAVLFALGLVPFAGIAFLWFVGVLRDRIGESEDRFFGTVFLGSALLFVAMLFVSAAVAGGLLSSADPDTRGLLSSEAWDVGRSTTHELMVVYAIRMAAVFTIATSTILMRTALAPRLLVRSGYVIGVAMLFTVGFIAWIELAFPIWVFALSAYILVAGRRRVSPVDPGENEAALGRGA